MLVFRFIRLIVDIFSPCVIKSVIFVNIDVSVRIHSINC